jgi:hypothetical protein
MISRSVWALLVVLSFGVSPAAIAGENPSGCRNEEFFFQDYTASGSRQMFRALLSAVEYRKDVRVYVTGRCNIDGYSEISAVSIVP